MNVAVTANDPLLGGFYTVAEAARLLRIDNKQRVYRWLDNNVRTDAVIARDYAPIDGAQELSFWDLIEVRFVEHFRSQGLSLQFLRKVAAKARTEFKTAHPFALSNATFLTDRRRIFQQTAEETNEKKVHDLLSGQYEMYDAIETLLAKGVAFDPKTALADEWQPLGQECPNIIVNPRYAYGHPVTSKEKIPTSALFRQWRAEGDRDRVAKSFGVARSSVDDAIEFELSLIKLKIRADEHISQEIVRAVRDLALSPGFELTHVVAEGFGGTNDVHWITQFADQGGEVILSADTDFLKRPHQVVAVQAKGLKLVHLPSRWANARADLQAAHILLWWRRIEAKLTQMARRECYRPPWNIQEDGELKKVDIDFQDAERKLKREAHRASKGDGRANGGEGNEKGSP